MCNMTVYIVRHGETDYNKVFWLQGDADMELNAYGRQLARLTAEGMRQIAFDKAFCSPLIRARETAQIILGERDALLSADDRLREISFGEYEGLCYRGKDYNVPDPDFGNFFDAPEKYTIPPGGEGFGEVIARTGAFWEELTHDPANEGKTILVVSHGGAIRGLMSYIQKTPLERYWGNGLHRNCAATILEVSGDDVRIVEDGKVYY